ncbi:DNA cytosine methyltransferase [Pseudovibrio brasiliensis]|uniref:DNA cytosine methyltransferase n=1 Tax=Pseudovibrio brasiliensis TaxID=1898042 RepID=UPI001FD329B3|nr:DNA cytosine methyltransferase [Pseudovibrio brasiliensis]
MPTIVNTKVSLNKGRKRVWIEGEKLRREGIEAGQYYDLTVEGEQLVLTINDFGARKVSRRKKGSIINPVIDLTASEVAELFSDAQMIRVVIKDQQITICAHHKDKRIEERVSRLMHKLNNKEPLDVCSLFHGGGVLDAAIHDGLEQTGLKSRLAVAVEIEPEYLASSMRNNAFWDSKSIAIEGPIEAVNLGKSPAPASILLAGLPCTGASKSGRAKNKLQFAESHDTAGAMFFHFLQFVQAVNPAIIFIENVYQISQFPNNFVDSIFFTLMPTNHVMAVALCGRKLRSQEFKVPSVSSTPTSWFERIDLLVKNTFMFLPVSFYS